MFSCDFLQIFMASTLRPLTHEGSVGREGQRPVACVTPTSLQVAVLCFYFYFLGKVTLG